MLVAGLVIIGGLRPHAPSSRRCSPRTASRSCADATGTFGTQQPPVAEHLLGTTVGGYDVLSRVIWGAQTAILVIIVAVHAVDLHRRRARPRLGLLRRLARPRARRGLRRDLRVPVPAAGDRDRRSSSPAGSRACGAASSPPAISITVVFIPQYFRVIRAETVRIKAEAYVESAKVLGASSTRIMFRHVLRNATRTLPLIFTLNSSEAILTLAGLGFLGFGIEPTAAAEWGYDLNKALSDVTSGIWWTALFPGLAIVLAVLGITLVGESLNDLADPRLRGRRRVAQAAGAGRRDLGRPRRHARRRAPAASTGSRTGRHSTSTGSRSSDEHGGRHPEPRRLVRHRRRRRQGRRRRQPLGRTRRGARHRRRVAAAARP